MTITSKLQQMLLPGRILAVQVGFSRTIVMAETAEGIRCGLAATLSNPEFEHHLHPAVRQAGHLHEMNSAELAALSDSNSFTERAIGLATINALLPRTPGSWTDLNAEDYLIKNAGGKNVAVVGHFPFIQRLKPCAKQLWVLELNPRDGDLPAQAAPEVLPQADLAAITATTLINQTFDGLISLCRPGAIVILLGPSTPLSPVLYDYGVNLLAGTIVENPQAALLGVGQGISLHQLHDNGWVRFVTMQKE
jgi:uncharacterized protein